MLQIIFLSSFGLIVAMIASKTIMIDYKHPKFWTAFVEYFDHKIHLLLAFSDEKILILRRAVLLFIFDFLPAYVYRKLEKMKDYVYRKYYLSEHRIRAKRLLSNDGSVSHFLKNIRENAAENSKSPVVN